MHLFRFAFALAAALTGRVVFLYLSPLLGFPEMHIPRMLGALYRGGEGLGWLLFLSSTSFLAMLHVLAHLFWIPVKGILLRGLILGVFIFILSSINFLFFHITGAMEPMVREHIAAAMFGNLLSCLIFGVVMCLFYRD